jgi:hypothetical protein
MIGQSLAKTVRAAEVAIERHQHSRTAPRVLWAGLQETAEAFALRCARLQLAGAHRVLAAVPHGFPVPSGVQAVEFAPKLYPILHPDYVRYRAASGGRDSAKSHSFGRALLLRVMDQPIRVLCARECRISSDWTHLISPEWDHPISG